MFVAAGRGLDSGAMDRLADWGRPVVVLATYGGKGQRHLEDTKLTDPINELLARWAQETRFSLSGELRPREQAAAREANYKPEAVEEMAHGIGEYMVAAPLLERRLTTGRHEPGAAHCREGVAVVSAAIDWQRAGMTKPIAEELLRELHVNYLTGPAPTEDGFRRGLEWALEPLYASVALLRGAGSFLPYDHIVAYADRQLARPIDDKSWDRIIELADWGDSFVLGVLAFVRGAKGRAERATRRATESPDAEIARDALNNLGSLLHERGELEEAEAAYRRGDERESADAAYNLGVLLYERGELEEAEAAFRRGDERGHAHAAYNLGWLLRERGELEEAEAAFRRGDERGNADAAYNLGVLLQERGELQEAEAAYGRAAATDDSEIAERASAALESLRRGSDS